MASEEITKLKLPILMNQLYFRYRTWKNETWIDSGGFQIVMYGKKIDVNEVLKKYNSQELDGYFSLDIPSVFDHINKKNFEYFEYLYTHMEYADKLVPVLHMYPRDEMDEAIDFYKQYTRKFALGGFIPASKRKLLPYTFPIYVYVRRRVPWLHVLGLPGTRNKALFADADQMDTSAYISLALSRKVYIPGVGEVEVYSEKFKQNYEKLIYWLVKTGYPGKIRFWTIKDIARINAWLIAKADFDPNVRFLDYMNYVKKLGNDSLEQEYDEKFKEASKLIKT